MLEPEHSQIVHHERLEELAGEAEVAPERSSAPVNAPVEDPHHGAVRGLEHRAAAGDAIHVGVNEVVGDSQAVQLGGDVGGQSIKEGRGGGPGRA